MPARFLLSQRIVFSAVHHLDGDGARAHYRRAHGHTFEVEIGVAGAPHAEEGWVADLAQISAALEAAVAPLKDSVLNDVEGLERSTLEHLCLFVARRLEAEFATLAYVEAARPTLGQRCRLELQPSSSSSSSPGS
jgi:6-pyruvoyltetrahydropterin/6-carboxytetrahydropterin synthase